MNALFILTSALNSKFGIYNSEQRLQQTLDSIASIKKYAPGSKIAVVEMAGVPPTNDQVRAIQAQVDYYLNYSNEPAVQEIYHSTDNWDIVKNTTEVMVFGTALGALLQEGVIAKFDRVFKMSGRYCLTENFDPAYYNTVQDRIVVLERKHSQFHPQVTNNMAFQYMSRLWSWPANETPVVINSYGEGFIAMAQRLSEGGYFDIEHMLFKYLPADLVTEVKRVGLRGLLGPNGQAIED